MTDVPESKKPNRHRKSTCAGCRRRKSKCDGKAPKCTTCVAYKDECVYDKPPSLAYVRSLEDEIQELKNQLKAAKTQAWVNKSTSNNEEKKLLPASSPASSAGASISLPSDPGRSNGILPVRTPRQVKWEADISVDDRGSVSFHNSTSAVHEPPTPQQAAHFSPPQQTFSPPQRLQDERAKNDLLHNADQQRQMEEYAVANTAARVNLPREVADELLKFHWCWIHPLFLFVYRPAFTRGMTLVDNNQPGAPDPPYFSETLLKVMHAHCARFLNHDVYQQHFNVRYSSQEFMQKFTQEARVSLAMETLHSSSIPTIQALLQQSAREVVFGRSSQGWLYGGMAFRMAFDMGIHLPSDRLQNFVKSLSAEDIEIRKRLFWSCYTWDKVLSLYLGRMPAFTPSTDEVPLSFLDDYSDNSLWSPYYGETPAEQNPPLPAYTPCPGYVVSCFQQLSKLCMIINELMQEIYSSESAIRRHDEENSMDSKAASEEPFVRIHHHLQQWWNELPEHLKIHSEAMPQQAPPIHIASLNLLYHTTTILLHRPVILGATNTNVQNTNRSYQISVGSTAAIHDLLVLQAKTFGLNQISYLNAYCAYMAATISVLRFEREHRPGEDSNTSIRSIGLEFLLDVISRSASTMPGIERSNAIIRKRMKAVIDMHLHAHTATFSPNTIHNFAPVRSNSIDQSQTLLAQPTMFQALSNPVIHQNDYSMAPPSQPLTSPRDMQSTGEFIGGQQGMPLNLNKINGVGTTSGYDPSQMAYMQDFLPAFPGQQFPVGSEHSFGSNDVDTQARIALMGYNLDPHPRLNPGNIDWTLMEQIEGPVAMHVTPQVHGQRM